MKQEILISVVVPVYNLAKYIERCINSILEQTYSNIEIIIVNDGSTDCSWDVIKEISEKNSRVVAINQENSGVVSARLTGIKKARGDWIGFVDGDDEIESDMYERLLKNALDYNVDISHCGYQMIFLDGRINYFYNTGYIEKQDKVTALKELLEGVRIEPGLCNKLFHKNLCEKLFHTNLLCEDIRINEDLLMNYILFSQAKTSVFEDVCKYHYIVRKNSASRAKLNEHGIFDPIRVKKIILEHAEKEIELSARKAYLSTCINVYNALVLEKGNEYMLEKKKVRNMICKCKSWFPLLSKKRQLLANMIYSFSIIYPTIYRIYAKFLLKNIYN